MEMEGLRERNELLILHDPEPRASGLAHQTLKPALTMEISIQCLELGHEQTREGVIRDFERAEQGEEQPVERG